MKKIAIITLVLVYAMGCLFYSFDNPRTTYAYTPDSDLKRDSLYQKDGTDSVFRYLRSTSQSKFLYRVRTAIYDRNGIVSSRQRTWADTLTPSTGSGYVVDISSAGFTKVLSVQAQVQTNTTVANDVPVVAVKSYTTSQVILNIVQGNTTAVSVLGVNVLGLRFLQAPSSSKIHVLVVGY